MKTLNMLERARVAALTSYHASILQHGVRFVVCCPQRGQHCRKPCLKQHSRPFFYPRFSECASNTNITRATSTRQTGQIETDERMARSSKQKALAIHSTMSFSIMPSLLMSFCVTLETPVFGRCPEEHRRNHKFPRELPLYLNDHVPE